MSGLPCKLHAFCWGLTCCVHPALSLRVAEVYWLPIRKMPTALTTNTIFPESGAATARRADTAAVERAGTVEIAATPTLFLPSRHSVKNCSTRISRPTDATSAVPMPPRIRKKPSDGAGQSRPPVGLTLIRPAILWGPPVRMMHPRSSRDECPSPTRFSNSSSGETVFGPYGPTAANFPKTQTSRDGGGTQSANGMETLSW